MSKRCPNKVRYESAKAARFFAGSDGMRAYRCPHCNGWHLTSQPAKRPRAGRRRAR